MPTYDYRCQECKHEFELFQQLSAPVKKKCPVCAKLKLKRLIGAGSAIMFKGSGFYETDYRSAAYKKDAKAAKEAANPKSDESKKSDSKKKSNKSSSSSKLKKEDCLIKGFCEGLRRVCFHVAICPTPTPSVHSRRLTAVRIFSFSIWQALEQPSPLVGTHND